VIEPSSLEGRWVHAHEEDTGSELVFRPDTYAFGPSRGRAALELRADGTYLESAPGPTDRPEESAGRWELEDDRLTLRGVDGSSRTLEVAASGGDQLVLRREGQSPSGDSP
jgi:hypothetical protein